MMALTVVLFTSVGNAKKYYFKSKSKAERKQRSLKGSEITKKSKLLTQYNVYSGPYKRKSSALKIKNELSKKFPKAKIIRFKRKNYIFLHKTTSKKFTRRKLRGIPLKFIRLKAKKRIQYYVVEKPTGSSGEGFSFGSTAFSEPTTEIDSSFSYRGSFQQSIGAFGENDYKASLVLSTLAEAVVKYNLNEKILLSGGLKVLAYSENGSTPVKTNIINPDELYLKYKANSTTDISLGYKELHWGRAFEGSPFDNLSTYDFVNFIPPSLEERSWSQLLVHFEKSIQQSKLDLVFIPKHTASIGPAHNSVWSPINQHAGKIVGAESDPIISEAAKLGTVQAAGESKSSIAAKFASSYKDVEYAVNFQKTQPIIPYYYINPAVILAYMFNGNNMANAITSVNQPTFLLHQPETQVIGVDLSWDFNGKVIDFELSTSSKKPVTLSSGTVSTSPGIDWLVATDFNLGKDESWQFNALISGAQLSTTNEIVDLKEQMFLGFQLQKNFKHDTWTFISKGQLNIKNNDAFIKNEIQYKGWDSNLIVGGIDLYIGPSDSLFGFYSDYNLIYSKWKYFF